MGLGEKVFAVFREGGKCFYGYTPVERDVDVSYSNNKIGKDNAVY